MKLSKKYLTIIGGVALIVLLIGVTAGATEKRRPAQSRIQGRERSRKMLETIRMVRTIEALELTEEQIAQFLPMQRQIKEARKEFHQSRKERIEELEGLLKSKASSRNLEKALENLKAQEKSFRERTESLQDKIDSILTIEQRARLIIFERGFQKEMREMLKGPSKREKQPEKRRGTKSQREGFRRGSERGK
jgi:Spy/CpxP family protein refolding chaperone